MGQSLQYQRTRAVIYMLSCVLCIGWVADSRAAVLASGSRLAIKGESAEQHHGLQAIGYEQALEPIGSGTFFGTSSFYKLMHPDLSDMGVELELLDVPQAWGLQLYSQAVRRWEALYQGRQLVHRHLFQLVDWEFVYWMRDVVRVKSVEPSADKADPVPELSWLELERGLLPKKRSFIDSRRARVKSGPKGENDRIPEVEVSYPVRFEEAALDTLVRLNLARFQYAGHQEGEAFRYDTEFRVSRHFQKAGWYSRPSLTMNYTQYDFVSPMQPDVERTLPVWEFDNGWVFEQLLAAEPEVLVHTVEPRLYYVYVPHVEQKHLPASDTRLRPFGLGGLFSKNRFQGRDRIGDTNRASLGVTTRLVSGTEGVEYLRADLAQTLYFSERQIALQDVSGESSRPFSDIASALAAQFGSLGLSSSVRWDTLEREVSTASMRLSHAINSKAALSVTHSQYENIEEGELRMEWLLDTRWGLQSSLRHIFGDGRVDSVLAGVRYQGCGFAVALDSRRAWSDELTEHLYAVDISLSVDTRAQTMNAQCR